MADVSPEQCESNGASGKAARRWLRWWHIYLVLLACSFVVQLRDPATKPLPSEYVGVDLPTQRRDGPVASDEATNGDRRIAVTPATVRVAYRVCDPMEGSADAPVAFLLQADPMDNADFNTFALRLADAGYRVIAPDLPGFGCSAGYIPDYAERTQARYVIELLDELDIASAHFVDFSTGGGVAINLYDLAPGRVESIALVNADGVENGPYDRYALDHARYALGYAVLVGAVELVPHFGLLGGRSQRHAEMRSGWDTDRRDNHAILERCDKPTLVLDGKGEDASPSVADALLPFFDGQRARSDSAGSD